MSRFRSTKRAKELKRKAKHVAKETRKRERLSTPRPGGADDDIDWSQAVGVPPSENPLYVNAETHDVPSVSEAGEIEEVIVATNPTVEGEATAVYLARLLKPLGVRVTRIAMGIPVGSDLEFADEVTLTKAMEGRREM